MTLRNIAPGVSGAIVLTLALAAAAALSPARAGFAAPITLSGAGQNATLPQVVVNAGGDALVVWQRSDGTNDRVQLRRLPAAGALPAVTNLSAAGEDATLPEIGIDADGNATIVWQASDQGSNPRIRMRWRSGAGGYSAVKLLSAAGQDAVQPRLAVAPTKVATAVWHNTEGSFVRIQGRGLRGAQLLNPGIQTLSQTGQSAESVEVAVASNGNAVVVWTRSDGTNIRVQARTRSAAGTLGPIQNLSAAGQDASAPRVAVDPDGNAVVVWQRPFGMFFRIEARALSAAGALGPIQTVVSENAFGPHQVAVDADGRVVVVWAGSDGANFRIQARTRSAAGAFGSVQTLSPAGQSASTPQVAVAANGKAVVVWERSDGTNIRVQARVRTSGGAVSPVQTLSAAGQDALNPQVAVNADGDAVVVWQRSDGTNTRIQAAAGP